MSSPEENSSESEESCEEPDRPIDSTNHAGRGGTSSSSESDNSEEELENTPSATSINNMTIRKVDSSEEESDSSEEESEPSAPSNRIVKAEHGSQSSSSSTKSLEQDDKKDQATVTRPSSDEESQDSESDSSETSRKKNNELASSVNDKKSDSRNKQSNSIDVKVEYSSNSSNSKSDDSDSDRESLEDEEHPDNLASEPIIQENLFRFSDRNLINYSSGIINLEAFSNNNDFWLVHCPKKISDEELQGAKLNFASETHLKIGERRLQTTIYPEKGVVACVLPSNQYKQYFVVGLPVKGSVVFEESVKLPKPAKPEIQSESCVEFPTKLKERHPLFGADYKERLHKFSDSRHLLKTSKKRRSKNKDTILSGNESILASAGLLQPKVEKGITDTNESFLEMSSIANGVSSSKHSKKRKRDKSESDVGINDSLVSVKVKKKKVDKVDMQTDLSHLVKEETSTPDHSFLKIIQNIKVEEESLSESEMPPVKEKKKKKKEKKSKHDS